MAAASLAIPRRSAPKKPRCIKTRLTNWGAAKGAPTGAKGAENADKQREKHERWQAIRQFDKIPFIARKRERNELKMDAKELQEMDQIVIGLTEEMYEHNKGKEHTKDAGFSDKAKELIKELIDGKT